MACNIELGLDTADILRERLKEVETKKRNLKLNKETLKAAAIHMEAHPDGALVGLKALLEDDMTNIATYDNVNSLTRGLINDFKTPVIDVYEKLYSQLGGMRSSNPKLDQNIQLELAGRGTSDPEAKQIAGRIKGLKDIIEAEVLNRGGVVSSGTHQRGLILADKEAYRSFLSKRTQLTTTEQSFLIEQIELGELKDLNYDKFKFNTEEDLSRYQANYGSGETLGMLDDFIQRNSMEIANRTVIGSRSNFDLLYKQAKHFDDMNPKTGFRAKVNMASTANVQNIYNVVSGVVDEVGDGTIHKTAAGIMGAQRAANTAGKLGSVIFPSFEDLANSFVGSGEFGVKFGTHFKNTLGSFKMSSKREMAELGYGVDIFQSKLNNRFSENGSGFFQKVSDAVMYFSMIQQWSESVKTANRKSLHFRLNDLVKESVGSGTLNPTLQARGLTMQDAVRMNANGWDNFTTWPREDRLFINRIVENQNKFGLLEPSPETRAIVTAGAKKGTAEGEAARLVWQFKSFPVESLLRNVRDKMILQGSVGSKIARAAKLTGAMMILGAVGEQARDLVYGKTQKVGSPWNPGSIGDTTKYWWKIFVRHNPASTLTGLLDFTDKYAAEAPDLGVAVSSLYGVVAPLYKNLNDLSQGKETSFLADEFDALNKNYNPLNIFYTRALYNYYVRDSIMEFLDPDFSKKKRREEKSLYKRTGQEYYLR